MISAFVRSETLSSLLMKKRGADFTSRAIINDRKSDIAVLGHKKTYSTHGAITDATSFGQLSHTEPIRINSHYPSVGLCEHISSRNIIETYDNLHEEQRQKYERLLHDASVAAESSKLLNESLTAKLLEQTTINAILELKMFNIEKEMKEIQSMAANTAHDLKSPLNTLMLGIDSFRTNDKILQNEDLMETTDCLESACAFMSSAINRSIDYSKIKIGMILMPSKSSFYLLSALNGPIKWIKSSLPKDGRLKVISNPIPNNIKKIFSDQHWVEENLLCLLSNAIKYSYRGTISITISLENCNQNNIEKVNLNNVINTNNNYQKIRVSVEDDGIGISNESKLLLFKQFSTLQNSAICSTGLGLYSLLKRSEAIDGSCGVHDKINGMQGSVFWYEFPYVEAIELKSNRNDNYIDDKKKYNNNNDNNDINDNNDSSNILLRNNHSKEVKDNKEKQIIPRKLFILLVDDSVTVIKCLRNTLKNQGHKVIVAYNGADGVDSMIKFHDSLDVVIMDLHMPVMDGIEACRRLREYENIQNKNLENYNGKDGNDIICSNNNCNNNDDDNNNNYYHNNDSINNNDNNSSNHNNKIRKYLPIICSSASSDKKIESLAMSAGMSSFLTKPFNQKELAEKLSTI